MKGIITKNQIGDEIYDIRYTWNDIIDPNPAYASDMKKASLANWIPYANPRGYTISISWRDVSIKPAKLVDNRIGWLVN